MCIAAAVTPNASQYKTNQHTQAYWDGTLQPKGTLDFYFDAAEAAVAEAKARYPDRKIHLLAHSIGGWCVCRPALFGPDWRRMGHGPQFRYRSLPPRRPVKKK